MPDHDKRTGEPATITAKTRVSLGLILLVGIPAASILLMLGGIYMQLRNLLANVWTVQHQILWAEQLQADNPTLKVAPADQIFRKMKPGDGAGFEQ
jgi:hypothetical protein